MPTVILALKIVAVAASFTGLCALLRHGLKIESLAAPLTAACVSAVWLMLGGMAGLLDPAWWCLFIAGLAGFVWRIVLRRDWPNPVALGISAAFLLLGWLRYRHAYLTSGDSISHWGMVLKYMLKEHRFPDHTTRLIYFQSYPLGSASFVYSLLYPLGGGEARYMVAQMMLNVFAYLPVFGLIRRNRAFGAPLALAGLLFLLPYNVPVTSLQVDTLLAFLTIGGMAVIAGNRQPSLRAAAGLAPLLALLVFTKSSGIFFGLLLLMLFAFAVRESEGSRAALRGALACAAVLIVAFLLWQLHVKLAYPGSGTTKHAVSLENYRHTVMDKSGGVIRAVAMRMARRLLHPARTERRLLALGSVALVCSVLAIRAFDPQRVLWLRRLWRTVIVGAALFAVWYAMLFIMYVFSMTKTEAMNLVAIDRYERTVLAVILGGAIIFLLRCFCRESFAFGNVRWLAVCAAVGAAILLAFGVGEKLPSGAVQRLAKRPASKPKAFAPVLDIRDKYEVDAEKSYMILTMHDVFPNYMAHFAVKYEYYSNDIMLVCGGVRGKGYDPNAYYCFQNIYAHEFDVSKTQDLSALLEQYAGEYDYILVCVKDAAFEAALAGYQGSTPVLYSY